MQKKELSQERFESKLKRMEYRSPILAKLGKLADVTLAVGSTSPKNDNAPSTGKNKTA